MYVHTSIQVPPAAWVANDDRIELHSRAGYFSMYTNDIYVLYIYPNNMQVPPVGWGAEDGSLEFHSRAGELLYHMLCGIVEGAIRSPALGADVVRCVLESIPLPVPDDDERLTYLFPSLPLSLYLSLYERSLYLLPSLPFFLSVFLSTRGVFVCSLCISFSRAHAPSLSLSYPPPQPPLPLSPLSLGSR